ncbi:rhodanese-like domain-containing protein [Octadecabacter sp.]|nr:rhodanese-like domain-containing protein [Octadecabacter sp.]
MTQTPNDLVSAAKTMVPDISVEDAKALHGTDGVVFLDVREPAEVAGGKVAGAVAIPRGTLEWHTEALVGAETMVVYCAAGGRAALAGATLKALGFDDVRNAGGFKDWVEAGGAVE